MASVTQERPTTINTRKIVVAGVLGAIAIALGVTQLGFIPVPNVTGRATIMHVPAIIGAVLEGPIVGILVGGIFGLFSFVQDSAAGGANPVVLILPRLVIGLTSWLAYRGLVRVNQDLAAAVAGVVGTLTNSVLVIGAAYAFGLFPVELIVPIIPQVIAEVVIAAVLTPLVVRGVNLVRSGRTTATESEPRDKSSY